MELSTSPSLDVRSEANINELDDWILFLVNKQTFLLCVWTVTVCAFDISPCNVNILRQLIIISVDMDKTFLFVFFYILLQGGLLFWYKFTYLLVFFSIQKKIRGETFLVCTSIFSTYCELISFCYEFYLGSIKR